MPPPLTDEAYWDRYWAAIDLPREHRHRPGQFYINEILGILDRYLPREPGLRVAELGGAPGQYLAYLHRAFGYDVTCIDSSAAGCAKTRENFRQLGIPGQVIHADIFGDLAVPAFDIVYSLGLIEHFAEREPVVERHVRLLQPGGTLVLGVPNFRGPTGWFMRRLAPTVYAAHDIGAMDLDGWTVFEQRFGLRPRFKGYVGGFEPSIFRRREQRRAGNLLPYLAASVLTRGMRGRFGFMRRVNGPRISGYAMAVYQLADGGR